MQRFESRCVATYIMCAPTQLQLSSTKRQPSFEAQQLLLAERCCCTKQSQLLQLPTQTLQ